MRRSWASPTTSATRSSPGTRNVCSASGGSTVDVLIERDIAVAMRDGTVLRANVHRPTTGGPFPVIMERTPYGKDAPRPSAAIDAVRAAGQGVAVVVQDVRGQGASEGGAFYMFRDEFDDGYDS